MNSPREILFYSLLIAFCWQLSAQPGGIDSLKNKLNSTQDKSESVAIYNELSYQFLSINSDSSLHYSKEALRLANQIKNKLGQASAYKNIAQAHIYLGQFDVGFEHAIKSLNLYNQLNDQLGRALVMNQLGVIFMYKGEYDTANWYLNNAVQLFNNVDLKGMASSYNILGNIAQKQGKYPMASDYLFKALTIFEQINNKQGVADASNNIGVVFEYMEEYEKALTNYQKSYSFYREIGDNLGVAIGLHNAGIILKKTNHLDSAIINFKNALTFDQQAGSLDGIAYDLKELGETYLLKNQLDTSYKYFQNTLKVSSNLDDPVLSIPTLIGLGNIHRMRNDFDSALYYLESAMTSAQTSNLLNEKKEAAKSLYLLFDKLENPKKALEYHLIYTEIKDELFNEANIRRLAMVEAEYLFEKNRSDQELQMRLENSEKDRQVADALWIRNTSIAGILVVSVIAFMIYFNYKRKKIANDQLNELYEELKKANDEIKEINSSLEDKILERTKLLQEQNKKLKKYMHSNSHVVRAPLARILALVELYKSENEKDPHYINENIYQSAKELDEVIRDINQALDSENDL